MKDFSDLYIVTNDCWIWIGFFRSKDNLPTYRNQSARQYSWQLAGNPKARALRSSCGNELCIAPWHLEVGQRRKLTIENRFLQFFLIGSTTECWEWLPNKGSKQYGNFSVNKKSIGAHKFAWIYWYKSDIPKGFQVCHRCDNPPCVNPFHLFLGSCKENMEDMVAKRRQATGPRSGQALYPERTARGTAHGLAKLNDNLVKEIRKEFANGVRQTTLAIKYNVTTGCIHAVVKNKTWTHVK